MGWQKVGINCAETLTKVGSLLATNVNQWAIGANKVMEIGGRSRIPIVERAIEQLSISCKHLWLVVIKFLDLEEQLSVSVAMSSIVIGCIAAICPIPNPGKTLEVS